MPPYCIHPCLSLFVMEWFNRSWYYPYNIKEFWCNMDYYCTLWFVPSMILSRLITRPCQSHTNTCIETIQYVMFRFGMLCSYLSNIALIVTIYHMDHDTTHPHPSTSVTMNINECEGWPIFAPQNGNISESKIILICPCFEKLSCVSNDVFQEKLFTGISWQFGIERLLI